MVHFGSFPQYPCLILRFSAFPWLPGLNLKGPGDFDTLCPFYIVPVKIHSAVFCVSPESCAAVAFPVFSFFIYSANHIQERPFLGLFAYASPFSPFFIEGGKIPPLDAAHFPEK